MDCRKHGKRRWEGESSTLANISLRTAQGPHPSPVHSLACAGLTKAERLNIC